MDLYRVDFYPRSPRGERLCDPASIVTVSRIFLSTLPARGATCPDLPLLDVVHPISIHAPREGSDVVVVDEVGLFGISIHAPREGSDVLAKVGEGHRIRISIHAPREGSDPPWQKTRPKRPKFLSTLPARGATYFCCLLDGAEAISIHAPREGSDT